MLLTQQVRDLLHNAWDSELAQEPEYPDGYHLGQSAIPPMPDRLISIALSSTEPGPIEEAPGLYAVVFDILTRGDQHTPDDALAWQVCTQLEELSDAPTRVPVPTALNWPPLQLHAVRMIAGPSGVRSDVAQRVYIAQTWQFTVARTA